MKLDRFEGAWTALVTPFAADGTIHWPDFERLVHFQIDQGVTGLVPAGTTGESPTLDWDEHNQLIDTTLRLRADRCFVLAGTGSNSTDEGLRGSRHAVASGAEAVLLVDCYYNSPSSLELRKEYHGAIAAACPQVFVVPYIIPGRTGTALAPEDLALLAREYRNVRAVKEATGDLKRMAQTRALVGDDFDILSGDDNLTAAMMADKAIRANGVVSVMSNVVPGPIVAMVRAFTAGRTEEGQRLAAALDPLFNLVTVSVDDPRTLGAHRFTVRDKFRNPVPIKTLMQGLGLIATGCRRPLGKPSLLAVEVIRGATRAVWNANPELLRPIEAAYGVSIRDRLEDDALWASLAYPA